MSHYLGRFVMCRSRDQGVVCGYLKALVPQPGGLFAAELTEARQVHWWSGCNTLFEMSLRGPTEARISEPVADMLMGGVCGVIPCEPEAEENLRQSRWNESFKSSGSSRRATPSRGK